MTLRLPISYFDEIYASEEDPWGFDSRWYEARKYALTLAALPRKRYRRAFEPGCANGALTTLLADRCDAVIATELVPAVVERARSRLSGKPHVDVRTLAIPDAWPEGRFDLLVLSEVAYYLTADGLTALLARADASLEPGAHVVAVHWTGETDYPLTGAAVHARLDDHAAWKTLAAHREESFLLSVYERR